MYQTHLKSVEEIEKRDGRCGGMSEVHCDDCPFHDHPGDASCVDLIERMVGYTGAKGTLAACKKWREDNMEEEKKEQIGKDVKLIIDSMINDTSKWQRCEVNSACYVNKSAGIRLCCSSRCEIYEPIRWNLNESESEAVAEAVKSIRVYILSSALQGTPEAKEEVKTYTYAEATRLAIETRGRKFKRERRVGTDKRYAFYFNGSGHKVNLMDETYLEDTTDWDNKWIEVKE